jgi:hypothetical protein
LLPGSDDGVVEGFSKLELLVIKKIKYPPNTSLLWFPKF